MAAVFRLANVDQTTTVDLLNGALKLRYNSFAPRTPAFQNQYTHVRFGAQQHFQYYGVQVETFDVFAQDTLANVIAAIYAIEQMLEKVRLWHEDPLRYESVWLEWNSNGESPKRSLIFEGSIQYPADVVGVRCRRQPPARARPEGRGEIARRGGLAEDQGRLAPGRPDGTAFSQSASALGGHGLYQRDGKCERVRREVGANGRGRHGPSAGAAIPGEYADGRSTV